MAKSKLVGLLFDSWTDMDRVVNGLTPEDAIESFDGGSSFAWTSAHVANAVDAWVNVRFQDRQPHPLIGQQHFRFGGTGRADDWVSIQAGVRDVREAARTYLQNLDDRDLERTIPYDGSVEHVRKAGLILRYAIMRAISHHYFHIGEISTKRDRLGHDVGDYPGALAGCGKRGSL